METAFFFSTERKPTHVLVVDDDPICQGLIRLILELQLKLTPLVASSGEEALDTLARHPVEIVITDLNMPGMGGLALLERVKSEYPGTDVIVISADATAPAKVFWAVLRQGAAGALPKHDIETTLGDLVKSVISQRHSNRGAPRLSA